MKCIDCRFWSEMVARSRNGNVEAVCLSENSPAKGQMMLETNGCEFGRFNIYGSIDEPGIQEVYDEDDLKGVYHP